VDTDKRKVYIGYKRYSYILTLDGISLPSGVTVWNLVLIFLQNLSIDSHIKQVSRTALFHLH